MNFISSYKTIQKWMKDWFCTLTFLQTATVFALLYNSLFAAKNQLWLYNWIKHFSLLEMYSLFVKYKVKTTSVFDLYKLNVPIHLRSSLIFHHTQNIFVIQILSATDCNVNFFLIYIVISSFYYTFSFKTKTIQIFLLCLIINCWGRIPAALFALTFIKIITNFQFHLSRFNNEKFQLK